MANSGIYEEDYDSESSALGVDSDVESNFDAESPADGYFSTRPHPQETFVENSSITAEAEAKAREREEERRASRSTAVPPSQISSPVSQTATVQWAGPETSFENEEDAPPDYESATATSSRPSVHVQPRPGQSQHFGSQGVDDQYARTHANVQQYGTQPSQSPDDHDFTARGSRVNAHVVTLGRALGFSHNSEHPSQSMRDAQEHGEDEESGLLTGLKSKRQEKRWSRGWCTSRSICNLALFAAIVLIIVIMASVTDDRSEADDPGHGNDGTPRPIIGPPFITPPTSNQCPYGPYSATQYSFAKPGNFSFIELMDESTWVSDYIRGKVTIRPAQGEQSENIRVAVGYFTTLPWEVVESDAMWGEDFLTLRLPKMKRNGGEGGSKKKPCLFIDVRIDIRPGVVLNEWEVSTGHLDILVEDGLFNHSEEEHSGSLQVLGLSTFNNVHGSTVIHDWSSRETIIENISGSIRGTLALLDLLSLTSQSGSISVNVHPKEASKDSPKPADFYAKSNSGSVSVYFPMEPEIPKREYKSRVETSSSRIHGEFLMGAFTSLSSNSGSIDAELLPVFEPTQLSTIRTNSDSSSTKLRFLKPYLREGDEWSKAKSVHKSTSHSGSINVQYPDDWSGMIDAQSNSGSISVKGKGVVNVVDSDLPGYHQIIARKGLAGQGDTQLKTSSSSIKVRVGEA